MTIDLSHLLKQIHCCIKCIYRFQGIRNKEMYLAQPSTQISSNVPSKRTHDHLMDHKCPACLGILESINFDQISCSAMQKLENFKLMDKTFQISLGLPSQLVLRQASIKHYLGMELNQDIHMVQVKEIVRMLLVNSLETCSGLTFDSQVCFYYIM